MSAGAGREHSRALLARLGRLPAAARGASPREIVYREDGVTLYSYGGKAEAPAVLIVYSLINRPYILDLRPERSLIRALREAGLAVYLIDWGEPEPGDRFRTLSDYIAGYLDRGVREVAARHSGPADLLGVCQGGTFALCYAALHPERVGSLATLVTPVDFHAGASRLAELARHIDVDALVDTYGNISADMLNGLFVSLKPFRLLGERYLQLAEMGEASAEALEGFMAMERWMYDSPDQAGEAFREFLNGCYRDNRLIRGELRLGARRVDLRKVTAPIYNLFADEDHLIPPASSRALADATSTRAYTEHAFPGGHLSVFLSSRAQRELFPALADWLLCQREAATSI